MLLGSFQTADGDLGLRGNPIPDALVEDIAPLAEAVPPEVAELLHDEVTAMQHRVKRLLHARVLPFDRTGMRYPWLMV